MTLRARDISCLVDAAEGAYDPASSHYDPGPDWHVQTCAEFKAARLDRPEPVDVNFSGGVTQPCWAITHPDGPYRVIYVPRAKTFSLTVDSVFGPVDIGVHGHPISCFASV